MLESSLQAWDLLFGNETDWSKIFKIPYDVTFDTRMQSFQYKILLRIFPCNWYVSKFDRSVEKICHFCDQGIDDICHFFFDCSLCAHFWDNLHSWIAENLGTDVLIQEFSRKDVILGVCTNNEHYHTINFIILYAKFFISIKKKNEVHTLSLNEFINLIRCKLNLILIVAKNQNNDWIIQKMCRLSTTLGLN